MSFVALIFLIASTAVIDWQATNTPYGSSNVGLFQSCVSFDAEGSAFTTMTSSARDSSLNAVRALMVLAILFTGLQIAWIITHILAGHYPSLRYIPDRGYLYVSLFAIGVSAIFALISFIIYAATELQPGFSLGAGFALCVVAFALLLAETCYLAYLSWWRKDVFVGQVGAVQKAGPPTTTDSAQTHPAAMGETGATSWGGPDIVVVTTDGTTAGGDTWTAATAAVAPASTTTTTSTAPTTAVANSATPVQYGAPHTSSGTGPATPITASGTATPGGAFGAAQPTANNGAGTTYTGTGNTVRTISATNVAQP